ncbi:MAG: transcriptional regulator [Caldilineaceae bacterium]
MINLKPIRTEEDYEQALQEIDRLWDVKPGTRESDLLEILVTLVDVYEKAHYELPPPDPIAALEYFMESRGWTRKDLEPYIGSRGRVSEILGRKRPLTLAMIRRLEQATGIPASILVQPYETEQGHIDALTVKKPQHNQFVLTH